MGQLWAKAAWTDDISANYSSWWATERTLQFSEFLLRCRQTTRKDCFNLNRRDLGVKLGSYLLVLEIVEKLQNIRNLNFYRNTQSRITTIPYIIEKNGLISDACVRRLQVLEDPIARVLKGGVAGGDGTGGLALAPVGKIQQFCDVLHSLFSNSSHVPDDI